VFYKYGLRILLFAVMMLFNATSVAVPIPALDLPALTKESSLIVVGRIVSVRDAGEGVLSLQGRSIPVLKKIGKIQVSRILKGQHSDPMITIEFVQTIIWYGIKDVGMERVGMFFLKSNASNGFIFTNYYYPFVVAAMVAPRAGGNDYDRVFAEVVNVLDLPQTTWVAKYAAIDVLDVLDTPAALASLRLAAKSGDMRVKLRTVAVLLRKNDISELEFAEKMLSRRPSGIAPELIDNLALALHGVKDPKAIPTLARLLGSRDVEVRRRSALALRRTGSDAAISPLKKALYDNDRDVRYHAVMCFAEITKQYSWAPAKGIYDSNEQRYLTHWRNWAASR
jgi:HEAT repeats